MVLANGSLSGQSGGEGAIRRAIIEDDLVECIIAMPGQLFYTTQIPVSLWFLNKKKDQPGKTLFIDAQDYILTPGRYVGIPDQADDAELFAKKMSRLTSELSGLFAESKRLEKEINNRAAEPRGINPQYE
jgi:type I restriction enzyme M protein